MKKRSIILGILSLTAISLYCLKIHLEHKEDLLNTHLHTLESRLETLTQISQIDLSHLKAIPSVPPSLNLKDFLTKTCAQNHLTLTKHEDKMPWITLTLRGALDTDVYALLETIERELGFYLSPLEVGIFRGPMELTAQITFAYRFQQKAVP